jgi:hypothetical protein
VLLHGAVQSLRLGDNRGQPLAYASRRAAAAALAKRAAADGSSGDARAGSAFDWVGSGGSGWMEKIFLRGQRDVSLMTDLQKSRVLEVGEGSDTGHAMGLWASLSLEQRGRVEGEALDKRANFVAVGWP